MTLDQLEMIEAIIEEGSFQAAARRLNKSQPSLSVGVKKVEELYGIEIFSREAYRPKLTQAGQLFFKQVQYTLSSYRSLDKLGKELGMGKEAQIRISMDPLVSASRLRPLLDSAREILGDVPIYLKDQILNEPVESLKKGDCDFAIGHLKNKSDPDIEFKEFCQIELLPMISKNLLGKEKLTKQLLDRVPNIVVEIKGDDTNGPAVSSAQKWFVSNHALKEEMIIEGLGWGRLSQSKRISSLKNLELVKIPLSLVRPFKLEIHFMRSLRKPLGPIAKRIWESH